MCLEILTNLLTLCSRQPNIISNVKLQQYSIYLALKMQTQHSCTQPEFPAPLFPLC